MTANTTTVLPDARADRAREMLTELVGPVFSDTALRVATDWLKQEARLATPSASIPDDVREDIICVREAVTDEQWERLWVSLYGLKCNPVMDEITLVMQEVVAILCASKAATPPASDAGNWHLMQRDEALIALRDAIDAIKYGLPTDDKLILENLQAAGVALFRQNGCVNHPDRPVRDVLDGKRLCQTCCENWAAGERP